MNRPCLDPSDPDCPLSAPNKEKGEVTRKCPRAFNARFQMYKMIKMSEHNTLLCGLILEP